MWSRDLMDDIEGVLTMVMYYVDRGWASRSLRKERRVIIRSKLNDDAIRMYLQEARW